MDNETFETLVEVIAFECANDSAKSKAFADIFYRRYSNSGASLLNLDAVMSHGRDVTVMREGKPTPTYVTNCEWSMDDHGPMRIRLELTTD